MSALINFNKAKKERARSARKARADENAVRFGRSKAEKEASNARAEQITRKLEAHKRET